ncbi:GNAT family N-acetyltransferase [Caldiplasma sukawensis]
MIRKARDFDSDQISYISKTSGYIDYISENVKSFISNNDVIVYEENGKILGFLSIKQTSEKRFFMGALRVHNEFRRQGVGTEMTRFLEAYSYNLGAKWIGCLIEENNHASRNLVEKLEYKVRSRFLSVKGKPEFKGGVEVCDVNFPFFYIKNWSVFSSIENKDYELKKDRNGNIFCINGEDITFLKTKKIPEYREDESFFFVYDNENEPGNGEMAFLYYEKTL